MNARQAVHRTFYSLAALSMIILAGCGEATPTGDVVETAEASGTLTYRGEPLQHYQVTVMPENNRPAVGISDESGRFVLGTNRTGDGAVVGMHPVAVTYVGPPNTNPEEGIMEFTAPPPPKVKIHKKYTNTETSGLTVKIPENGTADLRIELR